MNEEQIRNICRKFAIKGEFISEECIKSGHINNTYLVNYLCDGETKRYILQRINTFVFRDPLSMMDNVSDVTEYIRAKIKSTGGSSRRFVLHFIRVDGRYCIDDESGIWRCYRYIEDSVTFNETNDLRIICEAGYAFGEFQMHLADYPVSKLSIAIPHFHNTVKRYEAFRQAIAENRAKRASFVQSEISEYVNLEETATEMYKMQRQGKLPLKVTHNDTKINNVLFDRNTLEHLAVIDLDTVMPGLVGFDYGDAIRFVANTCAEDERDTSKVALDIDKFEAFTCGFVSKVGCTLNSYEKSTLALGAITMTAECGLRFLTDYLNGDEYFKIAYPEHNIDRARCQLALAHDMLHRYDEMKAIVSRYCDTDSQTAAI